MQIDEIVLNQTMYSLRFHIFIVQNSYFFYFVFPS